MPNALTPIFDKKLHVQAVTDSNSSAAAINMIMDPLQCHLVMQEQVAPLRGAPAGALPDASRLDSVLFRYRPDPRHPAAALGPEKGLFRLFANLLKAV
ncbi:MAG: hypothetical protein AB1426_05635 [Bacillota bacterium]